MTLPTYVAVEVGSCVCALPIAHVVETMRALPLDPIANAPAYVAGLAIIRGAAVPVVDLGTLLGIAQSTAGSFVSLALGERRVAVRVDRVLGVRQLASEASATLPPLLRDASAEHVASLGALDKQLLVVLNAGALFP